MAERQIPKIIGYIDGKPITISQEMLGYFTDIEVGGDTSFATLLAGNNRAEAKADGIIAGTQVLASVTTADAGNLPAALAAQAETIDNVAGGGFTVALNRYSVTNNAPLVGPGTVTTQSVTATIFGGTGPFTQLWTNAAGATFTINSDTALTTTFDRVMVDSEIANGTYRITVTDSTLATATADVAVNAYSTPLN